MERIYTFRGRVVRESDAAFYADLDLADDLLWLPKSGTEYDHNAREFSVEEWVVKLKDLPR